LEVTEEKKERIIQETSEAAENAKALEAKSNDLSSEINARMGELQETQTLAVDELQEREDQLRSEVSKANQSYAGMVSTTNAAVEEIRARTYLASSSIDKAHEHLEIAATVVIVAALIVLSILVLLHGFVLDIAFIAVAGSTLSPAAVIWFVLRHLRASVNLEKYAALDQVHSITRSAGQLSGHRIDLDANLASERSNVSTAWNLVTKIGGSVRTYILALDQYYSSLGRISRQQEFCITMKNAIRQYGFQIHSKIEDYFRVFGPLNDTEYEWLGACTKNLSPMLGVSPVILTLAYADFVGDRQLLNNAWSEISINEVTVTELGRLLVQHGVLEAKYLGGSPDSYGALEALISKQASFSLESFRSVYYDFYVGLVAEKRSLLDALRVYRIKSDSAVEDVIRNFVPNSLERDRRLQELFLIAAREVSLPADVISVAYYERDADPSRRIQSWERIRANNDTLRLFAAHLVDNGIIDVPSHYRSNRNQLIAFLSQGLASLQEFTLQDAHRRISGLLDTLDARKGHFIRALSSHNVILSESDRYEFNCWLQDDPTYAALAGHLSQKTGVHPRFLLLFLHDYLQNERESREVFLSLREDPQLTTELAGVLLTKGVLASPHGNWGKESADRSNLALLLQHEEEFDPFRLQARFDSCYRLLEYSMGLAGFLGKHKLVDNSTVADFAKVVKLVSGKTEKLLDQLGTIVISFLKAGGPTTISQDPWLSAASAAILVLFLDSREDVMKIEACTNAASSDRSRRILYSYIRVREEDGQAARPETPLLIIIEKVIDETYQSYEHLVAFSEELTSGYLYPKISLLLASRLTTIQNQVDKLGEDRKRLEETLQTVGEAVREFLNTELSEDVILQSLNMQLVAGYMITSSSREAVFTDVVDNYLQKACNQLEQQDPRYSNLLLLAKKTSGGKATRTGIVPFGMSFEEFSELFDKAFQTAVSLLVATNDYPLERANLYSAILARVFPTKVFFKRIEGSMSLAGVLSPDDPVSRIRELIIARYGPVQNLELVASLHSGEGKTVAMREVVTRLFDTRTSIYQIAKAELQPYIRGSKIGTSMESKDFDRELLLSFGYATFSSLARHIYKSHKKGTDDSRAALRKRLRNNIESITKGAGARLDPSQLQAIDDAVFAAFYNVGAVIEGFVP
jgi:hypothetical protein